VDAGRRRHPVHRGDAHAGQAHADADRAAGRRHQGIGAGRPLVGSLARVRARPRARVLGDVGYPRARPGRGDSERRALGRRHHDDRACGTPPRAPGGLTRAPALVSSLAGRRVRPGVAMTGEVSLAGRVLPVGGIKEKVLAAHRAGIRTVLLPKRNEKDLIEDVPRAVRDEMTFHLVDAVPDVLRLALEATPTWPEGEQLAVTSCFLWHSRTFCDRFRS